MFSRFFAALATVIVLSTLADTQQTARNQKKEQLIVEELAKIAPKAVETFKRGTDAMDKRDYQQAVQLYREVTLQAPTFTPALRRLGFSLAASGKSDEALVLVETAVQDERSPENLASLAELLTSPSPGKKGTPDQLSRALALATEAYGKYKAADDPSYALLLAHLGVVLQKDAEFREATSALVKNYPGLMATHYYNAILLAHDGNWVRAENEIKKAEQMGLPPQAAKEFLDSGVHTRAVAWRSAYFSLYVVAAWACCLFLLFASGKLFSRLMLRFIEKSDPNSQASRAETQLRRSYRSLIAIAGSFYYISIPIVIFLVLAVTGSILYGFLVLGRVPIKLALMLVIGAIVTVFKMVQSLFVQVKSEDPGRILSLEEAPGLWQLTADVAQGMETRPVNDIRVLPGTELFVYERGSRQERQRDLGQRILVIGVGLLPGFSQNSFRAVLAHEFGHFSHRDTAGGDIALRVNQDMMKFAYAMVHAGQAVWWNVAFQFLRLYNFLFRRISYGATRLQEVLADRASARLYGPGPFEEGLRHVIRRNIEFNHLADAEIHDALKFGRALQNIYTLEPHPEKAIDEKYETALNRQTSEEDTHPSPVDRFRLVSRVVSPNQKLARSGSVWELFADRDKITQEMSSQIERRVHSIRSMKSPLTATKQDKNGDAATNS